MSTHQDAFGTLSTLETAGGPLQYYALPKLEAAGVGPVSRLPKSMKVLLEAALRNVDDFVIRKSDVEAIAQWNAADPGVVEVPFKPGRVVLQDFTGVPAVVDLAALRDACTALGGDPKKINPLVPCDLVIDHSVQVDNFGKADSLMLNTKMEFQRNRERYEFLKWGQQAFDGFSVVPPGMGIVHQVNLEHLASGVMVQDGLAYPDSLVGTDSHTTMINGLGVVGWGVGGIEAEAVMLDQPIYMLLPRVVGFKLNGNLREGATATDLVLTVTEILRAEGVVGQFVEFYGDGLASLSLADRATIANMAPEYGATMGYFPIDSVTLDYMRMTARSEDHIARVEAYTKAQGLWREPGDEPDFTRTIELDLSTVEPSLAGPKRPQDRIALTAMREQWRADLTDTFGKSGGSSLSTGPGMANEGPLTAPAGAAVAEADPGTDGVEVSYEGETFKVKHGAVVIAAITSCTNTSNPSVMLAAGLVARNALQKGLQVKPWVKTSLAPGSRVVTDYYNAAGLMDDLEALHFNLVGYGCTTCIGNSGPLPPEISKAVNEHDLVVASVLSGNRNFEGRVNPDVKANYLASPPLVVAYALAGTVDIDLTEEPLGTDQQGEPVFLKDIWPSQCEIQDLVASCVKPEQFRTQYAEVLAGDEQWQALPITPGERFAWQDDSTYIQSPPFFEGMTSEVKPIGSISGARCVALLGDSVTTDHISPAGAIKGDSPAGAYLQSKGVPVKEFNSYGSRRGNHEVMMRGTFANIRLRNLLAPGTEGGYTTYLEDGSGEVMSIYDACMKYQQAGRPLVVLAGKEYGTGSSRDWAAKGTFLLGIRAVIAESFERIHRSNLVGMGVLPLQMSADDHKQLTGKETFDIAVDDNLQPGQRVTVNATREDGSQFTFETTCRIDTPVEVEYYRNGGILHTVLRKICAG
ncbi:MAG: aconitate hydratase AcnA [Phycisphaeraceae bacterium]